jgi:hypothetical protein
LVGNEQEHFRQPTEWGLANAISANIDDRTMHELYLWPFGDSIKAGVVSVMCSYNMINNSYACGNSKLLNGIVRDEMGFQGFVMSDWLAQRSGVSTALAGLDVCETFGLVKHLFIYHTEISTLFGIPSLIHQLSVFLVLSLLT